jgi:thiamine pyrophosphokinase
MRLVLIGPQKIDQTHLKKNLKKRDVVIAVDGGVDRAVKMRIKPHVSIGDWDSIKNPKHLLTLHHYTLLKNKDQSDFYYALTLASALNAVEVVAYGFTGGRSDHQLAALYDLADFSESVSKKTKIIQLVGPDAHYYFVSAKMKKIQLKLKPKQIVSILPLSGIASGVTLKGFAYPLKKSKLSMSSQGLSNVVSNRSSTIQVKKGNLVVIIPKLY